MGYKVAEVTDLMDALAAEGWCIVLKRLPRDIGWIIEGARSEYDAPSDDKRVGCNKWCCEAMFIGDGKEYRHSEVSFGDRPFQAVQSVWEKIKRNA